MPRRSIARLVCFAVLACFLLILAAGSILLAEATLHVGRVAGGVPASDSNQTRVWRDVVIQAEDGAELHGWLVQRPHPGTNCVVVLHGIGDSRLGSAGFAPLFLAEGYTLLLPDSRAHGTSGGEIVTYGVLEKYDVLRWAEWMRQRGCAKIYGLGESLGAAILIQSASVRPAFAANVAECSYLDLPTIGRYRVAQLSHLPGPIAAPVSFIFVEGAMLYARIRYHIDLRQASPLKGIARTSTAILLIHGMEDSSTPADHSMRLARANPRASLWLVPGAGHVAAFSTAPGEFRMRVLNWFATH